MRAADIHGDAGREPLPVLRVNVREVGIVFSATDRYNRPVWNLATSDLKLLEDGVETTVTDVEPSWDRPVHITLLVDTSTSVERDLAREVEIAAEFANRVLRPEFDRLSVFSFASQVRQARLVQAEQRYSLYGAAGGGLTVLYDAVIRASEELAKTEMTSRRVLILLSDGEDTLSMHSQADMLKAAERSGAVVYPIVIHSRKRVGDGDALMNNLARITGGRAFFISDSKDVASVFQHIETEMRAQYMLLFRPRPARGDASFRRLAVIPRDDEVRVHAPEGYVARWTGDGR